MKRFFLTCVMIFTVAIVSVSAARDGQAVAITQLPATAQQFLTAHFAGKTPAYASKEKKFLGVEYTVYFNDRAKVEFNSAGEWTEVECKHASVPAALVPDSIASFIKTNYPQASVTKIERLKRFWEVDMNNGIELKFDQKFNLIGIDD